MLGWFWLICLCVFIPTVYVLFRPSQYQPHKVFVDKGESVLICHTPMARVFNNSGKEVWKSKVIKIQVASSIISIFSAGGNAVDIFVPRIKDRRSLAEHAKKTFTKAEVVEIES